ncbi:MAG: LysM peptidoglycan-binding domain-containing protein [Luteolibacter sp.]
MTPIRLLASTIAVIALASCANRSEYDTSDPYGTGDSGSSTPSSPSASTSNPVYDSPAAYEENTGGGTPVADASLASDPAPSAPAKKKAPAATIEKTTATTARSGGTTHTVAKGDSLWTISKKYNVPVASIKAANHMTTDVVVLGKKLVIPAR